MGGGPWPPPTSNIFSVFDVLNIFWAQWFLSQEIIIKNIIVAQKGPNSAFTWVELTPQYHSFLIWSGLQLILHQLVSPHPPKGLYKLVAKVMFMFILEILSEGPQKGFFDLLKNP
jgi:hypothetical protein